MRILALSLLSLCFALEGRAGAAPCLVHAECDDSNPCTEDACAGLAGCLHANITAVCDDGDACTGADRCRDGSCIGGAAVDCDDSNPCTDDLCHPGIGCLHADNHTACDDGNGCTADDVCQEAVCTGGGAQAGCTACQAFTTLPPEGGTFAGTIRGARAGGCGSVPSRSARVYRWTPLRSGSGVVHACGGSGSAVVALRAAGCEEGSDLGCAPASRPCDGEPGSGVSAVVTAGQTYYVVVHGEDGDAYRVTVAPPSVCGNDSREGAEECDGADAGRCPSGICAAGCRCLAPAAGLPDLVPEIDEVSLELDASVGSGDVAEGCAERTAGVDLLRFTVRSANAGSADFALGDPGCPSPCREHPLARCENPDFICSPADGHDHAHYTDYARYELLDALGRAPVVGHKQGFCLRDGDCAEPHYTCDNQGISAGCTDTYSARLGCQYLDVTGLRPGRYILRVTIDPFERIAELDERNNVASLPVTLPGEDDPGGAAAACLADDTCVDLDACTQDRCIEGTCRHAALLGLDAITCLFANVDPQHCAGTHLATRLGRARRLLARAARAARPERTSRLLARAIGCVRRAAKRAGSQRFLRAAPACAPALTRLANAAEASAERWRQGLPGGPTR